MEGPFRAPRFGRAFAPVARLEGPTAAVVARGLAAALADPAACAAAREVMECLRAARIGGAPGLPDPGPSGLGPFGLGLPPSAVALVLDPGEPARRPAALAVLR
ncbi:MAG: hypothetical protein AAGC69_13655, partial [Paracraurococcus sp.]